LDVNQTSENISATLLVYLQSTLPFQFSAVGSYKRENVNFSPQRLQSVTQKKNERNLFNKKNQQSGRKFSSSTHKFEYCSEIVSFNQIKPFSNCPPYVRKYPSFAICAKFY